MQGIRCERRSGPVGALALLCLAAPTSAQSVPPPVRTITHGPLFHWFGYYDKQQFDQTGRYVLGMQVDFEHRSPRAADVIKIGMVDLQDNDKWIELGTSKAWGWQQGCMLQWVPGTSSTILWNDRRDGRFVCHLMDVSTRQKRTINHPIYTVTPDGRFGASVDFGRIQDMRPGYGYAGLPDSNASDMAPKDSGIWLVDLATGKGKLIVSLADVARMPFTGRNVTGAKHYFNHLLFNADGSRLEFLHRYRPNGGRGGFITRMLTCGPDGSGIHTVDPSGNTSHFIWRGVDKILAWSRYQQQRGFFLYEDKPGGGKVVQIGKGIMTVNGHCTYLPSGEWILNDTYPAGKERQQHVYLYHIASGKRVSLGRFHSPKEYAGEWRVDTHPRVSRDGRTVCIDSPHTGKGRQLHLIDIRKIIANPPKR